MKKILQIDASCRSETSVSRKLSRALVKRLRNDQSEVIYRDVSRGLPFIDESTFNAFYTPQDERTEEQNQLTSLSDQIVAELMECETLVLGVPMHNFTVAAGLKAWADLAARVGVTFRYTEQGPLGLLEGKRAYVAVATGGAVIDSEADFLTPWLRFFLGFLGIREVQIVKAEGTGRAGPDALATLLIEIEKITA